MIIFFDHTKFFGPTYTFNDEVKQAFPANAKLHVTTDRGNLNIQDSDDNQIKIVIAKRLHARSQQDADKYNLSTKPKINSSANLIEIDANTQGAGDHGVSTDMTISVPRRASVEISTHRGNVSVLGRDGDADISSTRGSVWAEDIKGKLILGASIRVQRVFLGLLRTFPCGGMLMTFPSTILGAQFASTANSWKA